MRISKELIEKYHDGQCSPDEEKVVEEWLFDDEPDKELILALNNKPKIREEMWNEISSVLPLQKAYSKTHFFAPFWRQAAAVILISIAGAAMFYRKDQHVRSGVTILNNASGTLNKNFSESEYTISIGPKSNVEINNETGKIDFCGVVMINPKKDIELTIQGKCMKPGEITEKMILKKGQNYIALNYGRAEEPNEVIILPETSMAGLPPLMQRQLMIQFNI